MPKTGIITQARMTSTRLPGKVLLKASGSTVLEHHVNRLSLSDVPIYVATTNNVTDQPIVDLCESLGLPCFRGDEHNVLQRFYKCAEKFDLDVIIRVTSDCPLIDGHIIADGLKEYSEFHDKNIYYSNALVRTFPRGMDFEIFSYALLKDAYTHATADPDKEHVTPYINQNKSGNTIIKHYTASEDHSQLRWTLDTPDDWRLIKILFEDYRAADLSYSGILEIINQHPELTTLNNHIKQKEVL